ncbi:MAG: glucose 1-dehydrogenase [Alphaproteobacteria bacterium]|nr:glucose 1-dehydrogenase [Alphaproteobacteria bacterium]MBE8220551.1 glucose 1-dehydrogenase [Alphaproteobacteria bacterium]
MTLFDLNGKTAVITGASRGIGEAIARRMAEHGANVVISSRKADACDKVTDDINATYAGRALTVPCNIGDKAQLQNLVDTSRQHFGKIDILVCNAAVNPYFGSSMDCPDDAFDKIMNSNVKSNHWLSNMVLPEMRTRKDGVIIVISSIGGLKGSAMLGTYSISKAADFQLVRNLAVEHGEYNIRANAIAPGLIQTYFAKALWDNPDILEQSTRTTPLRRIGQPDEIAGAAVFLASEAGAYTNGQQLVIDGGQTIT